MPKQELTFEKLTEINKVFSAKFNQVLDDTSKDYLKIATEIVVNNGMEYRVTKIGNSAFEGHTEIVSIDLPDSIQIIGQKAFMNCTNLSRMD